MTSTLLDPVGTHVIVSICWLRVGSIIARLSAINS